MMETKTEQMAASENASASKGMNADTVESVFTDAMPERVAESSATEKKPAAKRSARSSGKRKSSASEKPGKTVREAEAPDAPSKGASEEQHEAEAVSPAATTEQLVSPTDAPSTEAAPEKKSTRRKTSSQTGEKKTSAQSTAKKKTQGTGKKKTSDEAKQETPATEPEVTEAVTDAPTSTESAPAPVSAEETAVNESEKASADAPRAKKTSTSPKSKAKGRTTAKTPAKSRKSKTEVSAPESADGKTDENKTDAPVAEVPVAVAEKAEAEESAGITAETESGTPAVPVSDSRDIVTEVPQNEAASAFEHTEVPAVEEIDVSGTPRDTFVFFSPNQLAAMEAEKRENEGDTAAGDTARDEETSEDVILSGGEPPSVPQSVLTSEQVDTAESAEEKAPEISADASREETDRGTEDTPRVSPARSDEAKEVSGEPARERSARSENAPSAERRRESGKRNDPHERDVMDKERVYRNLFEILTNAGELERRFLIEETMKTIPLTDEERKDNHPTSLSNRVRSVIGSLLGEQIAAGKIVPSGRKLTVPKPVPPTEMVESELEEEAVSEHSADPVVTEPVSDASAEIELPSEDHAELEIEIISDETENEASQTETVTEEEEPAAVHERFADETPTEVREPAVREHSQRRMRQVRPERRLNTVSPAPSVTAILITEEEIERVILNAVRRNSATKNDLFAALKHVYVEPNRLSKEEENRIYGVAGNVLQKLVNRGTLQNSDGRYLQKPSQRILNPGRTPGAFSTGNVEARFITELNRQSGDFFEQFAARLLEKYFEMSNVRVDASYVVGGSDDNGIDIMLETTDWLGYKERVFVQAKKRATQPVTLKEVREFYGALCAEEGTRGVFITTSSFCMEASKMIGKIRNLIAIDKRKLFALAEHCEVGLVRDEDGRLLLDENLFLDYDV